MFISCQCAQLVLCRSSVTKYHFLFIMMSILRTPVFTCLFFLMIRRPPRSTLDRSSAASDVYKRQVFSSDTIKMGILSPSREKFEEGKVHECSTLLY